MDWSKAFANISNMNGADLVTAWYIKCLANCSEAKPLLSILESTAEAMAERLGEQMAEEDGDFSSARGRRRALSSSPSPATRLNALRKAFAKFEPPAPASLEANIRYAQAEFNLSPADTSILALALRALRNGNLRRLTDEVYSFLQDMTRTLHALTGCDIGAIEASIGFDSPLSSSGMVVFDPQMDESFIARYGAISVRQEAVRTMHKSFANAHAWSSTMIGEPASPNLEWADYEHLGPQGELLKRILAGVKAGDKGVNILLHGGVGTGKTEFAKTLAAEAGCRLWSVCERDENGQEPSRHERLSALQTSSVMLQRMPHACLLLDEAEDVLEAARTFGSDKGSVSKAYVNRCLEGNQVPVIWTCNSLEQMDPAVIRRMTMVLEVRTPGLKARARIWRRATEIQGLAFEEADYLKLAREWPVPAAMAMNAAKAARLSGGGMPELQTALNGVVSVVTMDAQEDERTGEHLDPELYVSSTDLLKLTERLQSPKTSRRWSILMYGAPGTGKSEYVRKLAYDLDIPVLFKRGSDLLSMWQGGTEKNIRQAFTQARTERKLLLIDEVEGLMASRQGAQQNHEVTQVNEFLTWMDNHSHPFACTTNLLERLDPAFMRRFTFKVEMKPLDRHRADLAFLRILGQPVPAPGLLPEGLTPGDFVAVRNKAAILGEDDPEVLVRWMHEEADARGLLPKSMGFSLSSPVQGGRVAERAMPRGR